MPRSSPTRNNPARGYKTAGGDKRPSGWKPPISVALDDLSLAICPQRHIDMADKLVHAIAQNRGVEAIAQYAKGIAKRIKDGENPKEILKELQA